MTSLLSEDQIADYIARVNAGRLPKPDACRLCHHAGHLRWHGRYQRTLITMTKIYALPIKRLLCTLCHHTFAWLPSFIVKFHRYAKTVIRTALTWLKSRTFHSVAEAIANNMVEPKEPALAPLTLYFWRRKFNQVRI
jgi:hypothetical protein